MWRSFKHKRVQDMDASDLLKALKKDDMFNVKLEGVDLSACTVLVLKGALPAGQKLPSAADEAPSKVVALEGAMTLATAAKEGACKGEELFVRVHLPASAGVAGVAVAGSAPAAGSTAAVLLAALPYAKLEPVAGEPAGGCQVLALYDSTGKAVNWPKLRSNKLLIRPVFREFFERADMFNCGMPRKSSLDDVDTLVRGIPGIGKSTFALYCLWRLVKAGRHVLYEYPKGLEKDVVLEFGSGVRSAAVYIADGLKPDRDAGIKLLVTSPRQITFDEFKKNALSFFMPEPTAKEVVLLRDLCFNSIKDDTLATRIERWGRVPRMVLSSDAFEETERKITEKGLQEEPLRRLLLNMEETGAKGDVSFHVVHYKFAFDAAASYTWTAEQKPARNYADVALRWASPFMEDLVWAFVSDADHRSRMGLLRELFADKAILSMSGRLWEHWCRAALDRGSTGKRLQLRRLPSASKPAVAADAVGREADELLGIVKKSKDSWFLPAPKATSVNFSSLADLAGKLTSRTGGAHRRFVAPTNFPAIDFWEAQLKYPCGSNATVSPVHDLIVQGKELDSGWRAIASSRGLIASASSKQRPIIHLWLVPRAIFAECKSGPLKIAARHDKPAKRKDAAAGGKAAAAAMEIARVAFNKAVDEAHALMPHIVQYAVLVPLPSAAASSKD